MSSDSGTKFVGAEQDFAENIAVWNKTFFEKHLIKLRVKVQATCRTSLRKSQQTVDQKLRKSNACSVVEQMIHQGRSKDLLSNTLTVVD